MLYNWLRKQILSVNEDTLAYKLRHKRMQKYLEYYKENVYPVALRENRRVQIFDIGGAERFWVSADAFFRESADITMINLESDQSKQEIDHFRSIIGDATDLSQYENQSVDLVFSNSCIEHVGSWENKMKMAKEMQRVGRHIYIQTPNKFFPIEPHFTVFFIQFFSKEKQAKIIARKEGITYERAYEKACDVNLLTYREMKKLFPSKKIRKERFLGLVKSFVVYY